jgi:hypothetical protein
MVGREDISVLLHTALRKTCDSTVTSAAWNLMFLLDQETTEAFYDAIWKRLATIRPEAKILEVRRCVRLGITKDLEYAGNHQRSLAWCVFKMFDEADWAGYCTYLVYEWNRENTDESAATPVDVSADDSDSVPSDLTKRVRSETPKTD